MSQVIKDWLFNHVHVSKEKNVNKTAIKEKEEPADVTMAAVDEKMSI